MAKMRVALFVTCLVDLFRPAVGFAAVKLLEDAGCEVIVPIETAPPVPSCLPITDEPSAATSAQGKPTRSIPGTSWKKE